MNELYPENVNPAEENTIEMVKYPVETINSVLEALNRIPWMGTVQFHFAAELDELLHKGEIFEESKTSSAPSVSVEKIDGILTE